MEQTAEQLGKAIKQYLNDSPATAGGRVWRESTEKGMTEEQIMAIIMQVHQQANKMGTFIPSPPRRRGEVALIHAEGQQGTDTIQQTWIEGGQGQGTTQPEI